MGAGAELMPASSLQSKNKDQGPEGARSIVPVYVHAVNNTFDTDKLAFAVSSSISFLQGCEV